MDPSGEIVFMISWDEYLLSGGRSPCQEWWQRLWDKRVLVVVQTGEFCRDLVLFSNCQFFLVVIT